MPTISQLPIASGVSAADELPISQAGVTNGVRVDTLLSGTQPLIAVQTGSLLGRVSLGAGGPEPVAPGAGLGLQGATLNATGTDHLTFTQSPGLQPGDEVVVNSQGQPMRMQTTLLRGLFVPGAGVTIGVDGTISAPGTVGPAGPQGVPGPAGSVSNATPLPSAEATDRVAVSRSGSDGSVQLSSLLASPVMAVPGRTVATSPAALAARRFDPSDWGALFDGAHDDAPAIQAALNAAGAAGGGVVHLPDTQGGPVLIGSGLTISASGVRLEGSVPGSVSDNFGDNVPGGLRLVWAGPLGGTMIQVAPVANSVNGRPLTGCGVTGVVLDCRSTAATGLAVLSVRRGEFEAGVVNSTGPGVLCDTMNLGEFNDVQDCVFDLAVSNVATSGACIVLDGTSRGGASVGNTSINRFRRMRLTYNAGDGLVINNASSNHFEAVAAQHRPGYASGSQLGSGRGIVLNGPTPGGVGAASNCFEYVNCDVHALAGSSNNQVRWLDVSNGAPAPSIDPAATLYVSTSQLVSSDDAAASLTIADSASLAATARAARGSEAVRVQAASGDHARLVSADGTVEWGLQVVPGGNLQVQPRKGAGQQVSLGTAALSAGGGVMLGDLTAIPGTPSSGVVLYSQAGQLHALGSSGAIALGGGSAVLPASASLIGSNATGAAQAITLDSSLTLTGGVLAVAESAPSTLTMATPQDTDTIPASQGNSGASFNVAYTAAGLAAYVASKSALPASAALIGSTAQGQAQAITLGSGLSLAGTTLSASGTAGTYSRPASGAFTWVNQGTATVTDHTNGPLTIVALPNSGDSIRALVMAAPAAPYTLTIIVDIFSVTANYYAAGLALQNATSGALALFGKFANSGANGVGLTVSHFTSPTAYQSSTASQAFPSISGQLALRIVNNGTSLTYLASRTGFDWIQIAQEAVSAAGSPDHVGFFANSNDNANTGMAMTVGLLDWEVLNTASPNVAATNARM